MTDNQKPIAIQAQDITPRAQKSSYPEPYNSMMAGRIKRSLGDIFGLTDFGINLTTLKPGAVSALRHAHSQQDEFIYILEGNPTVYTDEGEMQMSAGMCCGYKAGTGNAHRLVNQTNQDVVYLEIGSKTKGDRVVYPDDDLQAEFIEGQWRFTHKDGTAY